MPSIFRLFRRLRGAAAAPEITLSVEVAFYGPDGEPTRVVRHPVRDLA